MKATRAKPIRGIGLVLAGAALALGCQTEQDGQVAEHFESYVPSSTPIVRANTDIDARSSILGASAVVVDLGAATVGVPGRYQVAVASDGSIFGLDVIDGMLYAFGAAGEPIPWGTSGTPVLNFESPPLAIAVHEDGLLVADVFPGRLRVLSKDGRVLHDADLDTSPWRLTTLPDETFAAQQMETGVVGRFTFDGEEIARYTVFSFPEERLGGDLWPEQQFVVGVDRVYVTTAETHEVTAYDVSGKSAWVLRADTQRIPVPDHVAGKTLGRNRRAGRAAGATIDEEYANVKWPEYYPALSTIATDAQDRLYVFPYVVGGAAEQYPVDVYDSEGNLIANGSLPFQGWDAFAGDSIYRLEVRDGQHVVVRYHLDLPPGPLGAAAGQ